MSSQAPTLTTSRYGTRVVCTCGWGGSANSTAAASAAWAVHFRQKGSRMTEQQSESMIVRVGGLGAVGTVVDEFYDRVLADPELKRFFAASNMDVQRRRLTDALVMVLGGDQRRYRGVDHLRERLRDAHEPHDIDDAAFDRVVAHLAGACELMNVDGDIVAALASVAAEVRGDIVETP